MNPHALAIQTPDGAPALHAAVGHCLAQAGRQSWQDMPRKGALGLMLSTILSLGAIAAHAQAPAVPAGATLALSREALHCTHPGNCVSSVGQWSVAPLETIGTAQEAREALMRTLAGFPEARIVREEPLYVDTIFTTTLGFRDEVEFLIDPSGRRIDFRSRSQIGLWDIGMNRRRMGAVRLRFESVQGRQQP